MDPGWKNLVHKYKTRAVLRHASGPSDLKEMSCRNKQTRRRSVETNSTKSWMKTNINRAIARRKTYSLNIPQFGDSQTNL